LTGVLTQIDNMVVGLTRRSTLTTKARRFWDNLVSIVRFCGK